VGLVRFRPLCFVPSGLGRSTIISWLIFCIPTAFWEQPVEEQTAGVRLAPVEAEDELVQIRLDVLRSPTAVVRAE
jgi:hypothetical protein